MASARDGCPGRMLPGASIPFGTLAWWEAGGMSGLFVFSASLAGRPLIRRSLPQTRFQRGVVSAPPRVTACLGRGVDLDTASKRSPEVTLPFLRAPASSSSPDNQPDRGHLTSSSRPRRPGDSGSALSLPFPSR